MDTRVLEGVLRWGANRPMWQQESIRRLLADELDEDDISALTDLCVADQQSAAQASDPAPLPSPGDVTGERDAEAVVQLRGISRVEHVNALAPDQTLPFAPTGLTIVQGDNGSGKSGYARILKQVCRARSPGDVLPHAFADDRGTPAADIRFEVNGTGDVKRWASGEENDELQALSAVSVYDVDATPIYIDKNNELAYRPFGLDVYDRLVRVCDQVKSEISRRIATHAAARPNLDELKGEHAVGQLIGGLTAETPEAEIDALAQWGEEDAEALRLSRATLAELHRSSPPDLARTKRAEAKRSRQLAQRLRRIGDQLSDEKLAAYHELRTNAATAREAADLAATTTFDRAPLPGVGTEAWRRLWGAARAYSVEHPYPGVTFPATHDEARCVLCQQQLAPDAADRLRAFDDFVAGQLATEARRLEGEQGVVERGLRDLDLSAPELLLAEIEDVGGPRAGEVSDAMSSARARLEVALGEWDEVTQLPDLLGTDLPPRLIELADTLESAAVDLDQTEGDAAIRAARERVDALEAREKLSVRREDVVFMIRWHQGNDALERARARINPRPITDQSARVTKEVVSQGLLDAFADKLDRLGAGDLPVRLKPQAGKGQVRHQLELVGARAGSRPGSVLSEGERSVVALAAFLAEVESASTRSAIVLDDPVTSLDHAYRERVVHEVFAEAQRRQVIVFTHDHVFVSELLDTFANNKQKKQVSHYSVSRAAGAGIVGEGPPWPLLKVTDRVKLLNERCAEARKLWKANDREAYDDQAKRTLQMLREAWERAVEEVVLNETVQRFGRQVRTLNLPGVVKLTTDDVATIETGMALTSTQEHDQAPAAARPVPPPDEVEKQVAKLNSFCKEYRNR